MQSGLAIEARGVSAGYDGREVIRGVLLARTLASEPELLLLDEPATGVDPNTEEQLMQILGGLAAAGRTVLVATHDLAGVMAHFKRVVCMNGGVVADGPVSILRDEAV